MNKVESLKKQIDELPASILPEVEKFIRTLRRRGKKSAETAPLLCRLTEYVIADNLPSDLAEQHDHYLYGVPKK